MFKRLTWYAIIVVTVIGVVILGSGFFKAIKVTASGSTALAAAKPATPVNHPIQPAAGPANTNSLKIVIIGDSIAKGTGDEKGKGFADYLPADLKQQTSKEITVENLGINGLKSDGLLKQLQDKSLNPLLASADIVLISIGGNDVRSLQALNDSMKETQFKTIESNYLDNLQKILGLIRKSNARTTVVFLGLYNPYMGSAAGNEDTRLVNTWNYDTEQLVSGDARAVFIPTFDLFKFNLDSFIAPDGLHPNAAGYQAISDRIGNSIKGIFTPLPDSSKN